MCGRGICNCNVYFGISGVVTSIVTIRSHTHTHTHMRARSLAWPFHSRYISISENTIQMLYNCIWICFKCWYISNIHGSIASAPQPPKMYVCVLHHTHIESSFNAHIIYMWYKCKYKLVRNCVNRVFACEWCISFWIDQCSSDKRASNLLNFNFITKQVFALKLRMNISVCVCARAW